MNDHDADALTLTESFRRAARQHLDRLLEGEKKIRVEGDLEGVHLMRTSCRRLRATLSYLGDHLDREQRKSLQRRLRDLMSALSPVRDLDVLRVAVDQTNDGRGAEDLGEEIEERLAKASEGMQAALDGSDYEDLRSGIERAIRSAGAAEPLRLKAPARIMEALSGVLELKPADWSSAPEESLHDLRKGVKKLRYALEAFAPSYGRPLARQVERCRDFQEALGSLQDAAVFASHLQGIRTFAAGQFIATVRTRAQAQKQDLPDLWGKTFGPKAMARLGAHLLRRSVKAPRTAGSLESPGPLRAAASAP
jgi:CHAD domain-containing protein